MKLAQEVDCNELSNNIFVRSVGGTGTATGSSLDGTTSALQSSKGKIEAVELRLSPSYLAKSSSEEKFDLQQGLDTRMQFSSRNNQSSLINVKGNIGS